ncbi:Hsp20/alpha crystallin family protein [Thermosulfurimonas marina]|uniref:Hsp20/alpha crystallin family protein n=2 Tax=Thermosulfurimonas marina TaxID=2047767 RepID=A0A6H1WUT2_9BACT|nr:Hsp20/alpha crystallin family protein [Thermosulfurimonas marina]
MVPPVDVYETDEGVILVADMPGVGPETLDVRVEDNVLYLRGEIAEVPGEEVRPDYVEVRGREYFRAFTLGPEFDQEKIEATVKHGVLRLFIPKLETEKPRKIEIKVAG